MAEPGELYDQDFFLWTQDQAAALRRAKSSNLCLDWENLAEEIESLGKSDRRELRSQIRRILRHLFKLVSSAAREPRPGWSSTINNGRGEIEDVLRDSPSLRGEVEGLIAEEADLAAKYAAADLKQYGEPADAVWAHLEKGGFTAEEVLGDWFPPG